jgi:hypothetical protein
LLSSPLLLFGPWYPANTGEIRVALTATADLYGERAMKKGSCRVLLYRGPHNKRLSAEELTAAQTSSGL